MEFKFRNVVLRDMGEADIEDEIRWNTVADCRCRQHPGPEPISKDWLSNPRRKPMLYFTIKNCS